MTRSKTPVKHTPAKKRKTPASKRKAMATVRVNVILTCVIFTACITLFALKVSVGGFENPLSLFGTLTPSGSPVPEYVEPPPVERFPPHESDSVSSVVASKTEEASRAKSVKPSAQIQPEPSKPSGSAPLSSPAKPQPVKPTPVVHAIGSGSRPEKPDPRKKGTLLLVFDDAGHNLTQLKPFLSLPFHCTIAVLPGLKYSREAARMIRSSGKEVILHQPMQAMNLAMDPGPGAITAGMSSSEIRNILLQNLDEIGPVVGINNHEGSLITANREAMQTVLQVAHERGIFFLDSRTNAQTVAPAIARELNMKIWERAVFLDNNQDKAAIMEAVQNGLKIAERKGTAIMIGHIWSNDLVAILTEMYPELVSQGYSFSTIADLALSGDFDE